MKLTWKKRVALIGKALEVFLEEGAVAELRVPKTSRGTASGYFTDPRLLAKAAARLSGKAPGVYVTLNPVRRDLLARAKNRIVHNAKNATTDANILRRHWLPVDFDAVRLPGISATDAEHQAALDRAQQAKDWLQRRGFCDPVVADSGNGGHVLYRINLPNDEKSTKLIKDCLQAMALRFNDDKVIVDPSTYNASRIWKLYGTLVAKGDNTTDRPHRRAKLLHVPASFKFVKPAPMEQLAATLPQPAAAQRKKTTSTPAPGSQSME